MATHEVKEKNTPSPEQTTTSETTTTSNQSWMSNIPILSSLFAASPATTTPEPKPLPEKKVTPDSENLLTIQSRVSDTIQKQFGYIGFTATARPQIIEEEGPLGPVVIEYFHTGPVQSTIAAKVLNDMTFTSILSGVFDKWNGYYLVPMDNQMYAISVDGTKDSKVIKFSNDTEKSFFPIFSLSTEESLVMSYGSLGGDSGIIKYKVDMSQPDPKPEIIIQKNGITDIDLHFKKGKILYFNPENKYFELWDPKTNEIEMTIDLTNLSHFKDAFSPYSGPFNENQRILLFKFGNYVHGHNFKNPDSCFTTQVADEKDDPWISKLQFVCGGTMFCCRVNNSNEVNIYSSHTGDLVSTIKVNKNTGGWNSDNHPFLIGGKNNNFAVSYSDNDDLTQLVLRNISESNEKPVEYTKANHPIHALHKSGPYVVGFHHKDKEDPNDVNSMCIWDFMSGEKLKEVDFPHTSIQVAGIKDSLLYLYVTDKEPKEVPEHLPVPHKKEKKDEVSKHIDPKFNHPESTCELEIWNLTTQKRGEHITQEFEKINDMFGVQTIFSPTDNRLMSFYSLPEGGLNLTTTKFAIEQSVLPTENMVKV